MKKTAMLLTACLLAASCMIIHAEEPFHRSITVTGTGTVTAKNDMATVNLSVQTMARDAKAAARDNADIMTAVRSAVLGAGATADHIETMGYNLYPNNQYDDKGRMKSTVYEADNRMKIVLHNLDQTGKVMDAAINAGANHIDSVIFSVRNEQEYRDEALRRGGRCETESGRYCKDSWPAGSEHHFCRRKPYGDHAAVCHEYESSR